jgi:hypothetical protein
MTNLTITPTKTKLGNSELQISQTNIISILAEKPELLAEVESVVSVRACLDSKLQLSKLKRENPSSAEFAIGFLIEELVFALNVPALSEDQVAYITKTLINEFWWLKIEDFVLIFKNAKMARYGKIYNRIDIHTICEWVNQYLTDRDREVENLRIEENTEYKKHLNWLNDGEQEQEWNYGKIKAREKEKAEERAKIDSAKTAEEIRRENIARLRNKYFNATQIAQ